MAKTDQVPAMHSEFPRWYRVVNLGDDTDRLQRRWIGLCAVVAAASRSDVEAMVRVTFRAKQPPAPDALARIRQPYRDADDLFEMQGNDREIEVLCGASLAALFERGDDRSGAAALAVTTTALGGGRTADVPMDLAALAEQAIAQLSEARRKRPDLAQYMKAEVPKVDFEKVVAKVREQPNADGFAAAFTLAADATRAALSQMVLRTPRAVAAVGDYMAIQDEELQMLWWLVGGRSWDLDRDFAAIPTNAQVLVFAKELADFTQFLPGPASIKALLSRAGLDDQKEVSIPAAINACDAAWLGNLIEHADVSPISQPIHFAIERKLETGDDAAWVPGWAAAAGVGAAYALPALAVANLFYRERLLITLAKG